MTAIDPGDGWRLLAADEVIRSGDQYYWNGKWYKAKRSVDCFVTDVQYDAWRRRIANDNTGVEVHTSGPYVAIEVHREEVQRLESHITELIGQLEDSYKDAKEQQAEIERLKAELEAMKQPQPDPEPEWFDLTLFDSHVLRPGLDDSSCSDKSDYWYSDVKWPEGSTIADAKKWPSGWSKFRCLLKDAPPELVAKANKPAEDPDEWVTQDRVPYRKDFDQCKWDNYDEWFAFQDVYPSYRHGFRGVSGQRLQVRCRRRDLPPMPEPKPKAEREVSLYWYNGNVVGRYADCPPTDPSFVPLIVRDGKVFIETETREVVR